MRAHGRLDSQRSGAEMGDGRSGMLPRPIAPLKCAFSWLWVLSVSWVSPVPPAAGLCPEGIYPTPLRFRDDVASGWADYYKQGGQQDEEQ